MIRHIHCPRVSTRKNSSGAFFLLFLAKCLLKCSSSMKPPLSWKIFVCTPALRHYLFCKIPHLKCLTMFWIDLCLDNCSVICIVTLCYVLHHTIRILAYSKLCLLSILSIRHINIYWRIVNAYSGLFRHIQHSV